jgi:hypothetical protein
MTMGFDRFVYDDTAELVAGHVEEGNQAPLDDDDTLEDIAQALEDLGELDEDDGEDD